MTNSINQPYKPHTAPRNSSGEIKPSRPYNVVPESPQAKPDDQSIQNAALPTQSPGSTSASPVGSTPGMNTEAPIAVPGGAVPSTPGV